MPIIFLPFLSRVTEKTFLKRLKEFTETEKFLLELQYGFQRRWGRGHQKSWHTDAVYLGIRQAVDRVWLDGLIEELTRLRFPGYLVKVIQSLFADRSFQIKVAKKFSGARPIKAGIPQGFTLYPRFQFLFPSHTQPPTGYDCSIR